MISLVENLITQTNMKKPILCLLLASLAIFNSCSSENAIVTNPEIFKSPEMENFAKAFKNLNNPENKPNEEERKSGSTELSDRRKKTLIPASLELIKSTGVTDEEIAQKTRGDMSAIIVWAIQINNNKTSEIKNKVQSEN